MTKNIFGLTVKTAPTETALKILRRCRCRTIKQKIWICGEKKKTIISSCAHRLGSWNKQTDKQKEQFSFCFFFKKEKDLENGIGVVEHEHRSRFIQEGAYCLYVFFIFI